MSLKAKIEAVIYAAEEPVTLSQLVAIFATEVPVAEPPLLAPETSPYEDPAPSEDQPLQLEAPLALPGHEVTTVDASGLMQNAPVDGAAVAPDIISELQNATSPAEPDFVPSASETELEETAKRSARQREREIRDYLRTLVDELVTDYTLEDRGIEIREIAGGYRMATKPEYHDAVRAFVKSLKPPMKLSLQALETLAVIAYKQPVTAPEVAEIRGVDAGGVLAGLITRKLVTTAGRKQVIGRPILYKTTKEFLLRFGLKDVAELPSMEEFEKMAGELEESDALEASAMEARAGVPSLSEEDQLPFEQRNEDTTSHSAEQNDQGIPTRIGAAGAAETSSASNAQSSSGPERSAVEQSAFSTSEESEEVPQEQER